MYLLHMEITKNAGWNNKIIIQLVELALIHISTKSLPVKPYNLLYKSATLECSTSSFDTDADLRVGDLCSPAERRSLKRRCGLLMMSQQKWAVRKRLAQNPSYQ